MYRFDWKCVFIYDTDTSICRAHCIALCVQLDKSLTSRIHSVCVFKKILKINGGKAVILLDTLCLPAGYALTKYWEDVCLICVFARDPQRFPWAKDPLAERERERELLSSH